MYACMNFVSQSSSQREDYYFYHWQYVEAFIYFSHHFLSLPPPCWTNAAHRNGRLCLGTMITEWKVKRMHTDLFVVCM